MAAWLEQAGVVPVGVVGVVGWAAQEVEDVAQVAPAATGRPKMRCCSSGWCWYWDWPGRGCSRD